MQRPARFDATTLALLVLPPLFWAGNAVVGRYAAGLIAPMALNALRWLLAGVVLFPFVWRDLRPHAPVLRRDWPTIAVLGVCGMGTYNALQYLALTTSTAPNVTLIAASAPIFALGIGAFFFGERLDRRRLLGAAVSIAGVLLVLIHGDPARLLSLSFVPGDLFMLMASALWSVYTWLLRTRRPPLPATVLLFAQIVLGSVFCIACAWVEWGVFGQGLAPRHAAGRVGARLRRRAAVGGRLPDVGSRRGARRRDVADLLRQPRAGLRGDPVGAAARRVAAVVSRGRPAADPARHPLRRTGR